VSIYTGAHVERDLELSCDVCVVGSGAGGAVVAQRLATSGKSVIVLEDGGFHVSARFDMTEANMFSRLYQEQGGRARRPTRAWRSCRAARSAAPPS
jgi:choline dehydrogenase-like flavoprotein